MTLKTTLNTVCYLKSLELIPTIDCSWNFCCGSLSSSTASNPDYSLEDVVPSYMVWRVIITESWEAYVAPEEDIYSATYLKLAAFINRRRNIYL